MSIPIIAAASRSNEVARIASYRRPVAQDQRTDHQGDVVMMTIPAEGL